jgi:hypothetical protein
MRKVLLIGLILICAADKTYNTILTDYLETLVIVTHIPQDRLRSFGQHTKAINEAYCSR